MEKIKYTQQSMIEAARSKGFTEQFNLTHTESSTPEKVTTSYTLTNKNQTEFLDGFKTEDGAWHFSAGKTYPKQKRFNGPRSKKRKYFSEAQNISYHVEKARKENYQNRKKSKQRPSDCLYESLKEKMPIYSIMASTLPTGLLASSELYISSLSSGSSGDISSYNLTAMTVGFSAFMGSIFYLLGKYSDKGTKKWKCSSLEEEVLHDKNVKYYLEQK